jgi:hypothetical protein
MKMSASNVNTVRMLVKPFSALPINVLILREHHSSLPDAQGESATAIVAFVATVVFVMRTK